MNRTTKIALSAAAVAALSSGLILGRDACHGCRHRPVHHPLHRGDHRRPEVTSTTADDRRLRRHDHPEGGDSALRISNAVTSRSFGDQLFSPTLATPATETGSAHTFTASFVLEPVALQPGLRVTVTPDNGQGGRGGFLAIEHTEDGMNLVSEGSFLDANADDVAWTSRTWPPGWTRSSHTP